MTKKVICTVCYSDYMLSTYRKNMQPALQYNSDLLSETVLSPEDCILPLVSVIRLHGHGELINVQHLHNFVQIAQANPRTTVSLWTKRKDFVKEYFAKHDKPSNMILIYSNPIVDSIVDKLPPYFDKSFNGVSEDNFKEKQNCTGQQCKDCLLCYTPGTTPIIVEAVKKSDLYGDKKRKTVNPGKPVMVSRAKRKGVHISKMTGKLDGLLAINTNTVTNTFCQRMSGNTPR